MKIILIKPPISVYFNKVHALLSSIKTSSHLLNNNAFIIHCCAYRSFFRKFPPVYSAATRNFTAIGNRYRIRRKAKASMLSRGGRNLASCQNDDLPIVTCTNEPHRKFLRVSRDVCTRDAYESRVSSA